MKLVIRSPAGKLHMLDLPVSNAAVEVIQAAILEETGKQCQTCFYCEDSLLQRGCTLSDYILELSKQGSDLSDGKEAPALLSRPALSEAKGNVGGYQTSGPSDSEAEAVFVAAQAAGQPLSSASRRGDGLGDDEYVQLRISAREFRLIEGKRLGFKVLHRNAKRVWIRIQNQRIIPGPRLAAPLPVALFFPPEGNQYCGMLENVRDIPQVGDMLKTANSILGYDLMDLCALGPDFRLSQTRHAQPAVFVGGLAGLEKLKILRPEIATRVSAMVGYGVGQYVALCAAGVMTFADGLRIVKQRAEAMGKIVDEAHQLGVVSVGLDTEKVKELCVEAARMAGAEASCYFAGALFPRGLLVAGTEKAVLIFRDMAKEAGAVSVKLSSSQVASETPLMMPASSALSAALQEALPRMRPPSCTVYSTTTKRPMDPGCPPATVVADLEVHLTEPVLWEDTLRGLSRDAIMEFYEVGPKSSGTSNMKRIDKGAKVYGIEV